MARKLILGIVFILLTTLLFSSSPLTFEDRVNAQEAIERAYYNHRIWPKENPQPKPPFEEMVPREVIEAKVTDYLKKSNALEIYWKRPITGKQLQAEMDRMAKSTQDPKMLKELFAALDNDPYLIAECLARPVLVDRLIRNWYAYDDRFHGELRKKVTMFHTKLTPALFKSFGGAQYRAMTVVLENSVNSENRYFKDFMELSEADFIAFKEELPGQGDISQVIETRDTFAVYYTREANEYRVNAGAIIFEKVPFDSWWRKESQFVNLPFPAASNRIYSFPGISHGRDIESGNIWGQNNTLSMPCPVAREYPTAIWTGTEMIVWGGRNNSGPLNSGGRYNPATDTWKTVSTGENCPAPRAYHSAIWTGDEMIIWGGGLSAGGIYNPVLDTWREMSTGTACPSPRLDYASVWTGEEMIIWGGWLYDQGDFNDGGRYNPTTNSWEPISTEGNCPSARSRFPAVWTGQEMIIWGGEDNTQYFNTGGKYNPELDTWTPTSVGQNCPYPSIDHSAVWTGEEVIFWGTWSGENTNGGAKYNPVTDSWIPTSTGSGCPPYRGNNTSFWTGTEMLVWGIAENTATGKICTGALYDPGTDDWQEISVDDNISSYRSNYAAVWTGEEMIVWGGIYGECISTGARYNPDTDSWLATSTGGGCPTERIDLTSVWTGTEMIIWGGWDILNFSGHNDGSRYDLATDTWTAIPLDADTPSPRSRHSAVWTGEEMIVWGGVGELYYETGGRYNPISDDWIATSIDAGCPQARMYHTAVWTGTKMVIWGGYHYQYDNEYLTILNDGGIYDPSVDSWAPTATSGNCPTARYAHTAVWTGNEMIVWGGLDENNVRLNTGGRYFIDSDTWIPTSTGDNLPSARKGYTAVWTGNEMIIWGGGDYWSAPKNDGGKYSPTEDSWIAISTGDNCPSGRWDHSAVWTGKEMIIWGGFETFILDDYYKDGGRYDPATDKWTPTSTGTNCPSSRSQHTAVWTGDKMIVWGGYYAGVYLISGGVYIPYLSGKNDLFEREWNSQ